MSGKKILSILLAIALALSLMPTSALAYPSNRPITDWQDLADAIFCVPDGETIVLTQDITVGERQFDSDRGGQRLHAGPERQNGLGQRAA